jgi:hypothetical protein
MKVGLVDYSMGNMHSVSRAPLPMMSLAVLLLAQGTFAKQGTAAVSASSCTSTQFFVSDTSTCADCDPSTGSCQDSSCVVFGYANSAKANCANGGCAPAYCNYYAGCSVTSGQQCFGTVQCSDHTTTCSGFSSLCLQDGNAGNFKICGGKGPVADSPSPEITCAASNTEYEGQFPFFDATCTPTFLQAVLQSYNCTEISLGCGNYMCTTAMTSDVASKLSQCQSA